MTKRLILTILFVTFCAPACGVPPQIELDGTLSHLGTPSCPDCSCEVTITSEALLVYGNPVAVDSPITSASVLLYIGATSCERPIAPGKVTVVPSELDWTESTEPCNIAHPDSAELKISTGYGDPQIRGCFVDDSE